MTTISIALRRDSLGPPDYQIIGGKLVLCYDEDATRDRIFTALSTQLGEWYLDNTDGVPYMGAGGILGGKMTEAEVAAILRRRILLDPEVDRIVSMEVAQDALRNVTVHAEVLLISGATITVST